MLQKYKHSILKQRCYCRGNAMDDWLPEIIQSRDSDVGIELKKVQELKDLGVGGKAQLTIRPCLRICLEKKNAFFFFFAYVFLTHSRKRWVAESLKVLYKIQTWHLLPFQSPGLMRLKLVTLQKYERGRIVLQATVMLRAMDSRHQNYTASYREPRRNHWWYND